MRRIVTDEQQRNWPDWARPKGVASGDPLIILVTLARGAAPNFVTRLVSGSPDAITARIGQ